ncbi:MAG: hypothetical protein OEY72_14095, partial [Gammaproteobacteria bacterium]|nr:hypothetical protein [Gammaproteobacteria bacterium]
HLIVRPVVFRVAIYWRWLLPRFLAHNAAEQFSLLSVREAFPSENPGNRSCRLADPSVAGRQLHAGRKRTGMIPATNF